MASNRSKAPEAPTTSRARSKRAASRKGARSIPKVVADHKVFAKPEFQVPFRLAMFTAGPGKRHPAPLWLQVAVLSGLVEMVSPNEAKAGDGFLKPIRKRHPLPRMKPGELDALMAKGLAEALPYLSAEPDKDKK